MVLVDNSPFCYVSCIENAIPIIPYFSNKNDREMRDLVKYLKVLITYNDVRYKNNKVFRLRTLYDGLNLV